VKSSGKAYFGNQQASQAKFTDASKLFQNDVRKHSVQQQRISYLNFKKARIKFNLNFVSRWKTQTWPTKAYF